MELVFYAVTLSWLAVVSWFAVRAYRALVAFVVAPTPDEPSPLGRFILSVAQIVANQITMSVKGTLMGHASALSKAETGMQADIMQDTVAMKAPMLGMILEAFPSLKKRVSKSAVARMALANMDFSKLLTKGGRNGEENTDSAPTTFGL